MNARQELIAGRRAGPQSYTVFYGGEDFDVHYTLDGRYSPGGPEEAPEFPAVVISRISLYGQDLPLNILSDLFIEECENAVFDYETSEEGDDSE